MCMLGLSEALGEVGKASKVSPEVVFALVQAVSVTAIGAYAAWIARQQLEINRYRVKLDLYNRRWKAYEIFTQYVAVAIKDLNPMPREIQAFARATRQAEFLFRADIKDYRKTMIQHSTALHKWREMHRDAGQEQPPSYDHKKVVQGEQDETEWFAAQPDAMVKKFEPYLDLSRL